MHSRHYTYMFSLGDNDAPATVKAPLFICTFWLETTFGISGTVLHWFASYLEGREQSVKVGRDSVDIGGKRIPFRSSVRNLGVHLDQTLSMQQDTSSVCRAAYLEELEE